MSIEKIDTSSNFKILNYVEKVLKRPARFIGSIKTDKKTIFVIEDNKFVPKQLDYNPGLHKIIREIIDNSVDQHIKTNGKYATKIDIKIEDGYISVIDNGPGMPNKKVKHPDGRELYICEAAWTELNAGTNFDDEKDNKTGGQNGEGAALTNIFSKEFIGKTYFDKENCLLKCTDNLSTINAKTGKNRSSKHGTEVKFLPDYERFGVTELLSGNIHALIFDLYVISFTYPNIKFTFSTDGKKQNIRVKNAKEFFGMFNDDFVMYSGDGLSIGIYPKEDNYPEFVHYINGLDVHNGGEPFDWVMKNIVDNLYIKLQKRYKTIKKADIKSHLFPIVIFTNMNNPRFGDQIKSLCVNKYREFESQIEKPDFEKLSQKILKTNSIIEPLIDLFKAKEEIQKKKELKNLDKKKKEISEKYLPPIKDKQILFICEGASAVGGLVPSLGRENFGYYELKGVPLNAYDASHSDFISNKELTELYSIIKDENYEYICIATDADADGNHIKGLLLGFFLKYLPNILNENKVGELRTPVQIVLKNKKPIRWNYDLGKRITPKNGETVKYMKGLGSYKSSLLKEIVQKDTLEKMIVMFNLDNTDILKDWLDSNKSDIRKTYISQNEFDITGA